MHTCWWLLFVALAIAVACDSSVTLHSQTFASLAGCESNIPTPPSTQSLHLNIRKKFITQFAKSVGELGVVYLEGGKVSQRYGGIELDFRQESNFLYLFGVPDPDYSGLVDLKGGDSVLFMPRRDVDYALWNGIVEKPEEIQAKYGVDKVYYNDQVVNVLTSYTNSRISPVYVLPEAKFPNMSLFHVNDKELAGSLAASRSVKTDEEVLLIRIANQVSGDAHIRLMKDTRIDMREFNLDAFFVYYTANCGLSFQAYSPIVGSGPRSAILHYSANSNVIKNGDLVLVDAGAEYDGYAADITRTFPANGTFTSDQKEIYNMVLRIQDEAISMVKPGVSWYNIQIKATSSVCQLLLEAGYLRGTLEELVSNSVCDLFLPHGLGHYVGLDVHDADVVPTTLAENMVFTIEPGIYFNDAFIQIGLSNPKQAKFLVAEKIQRLLSSGFGGVRIEDDILVTPTGFENLTKVPKTVEEIEAIMKSS